MVEQQSLINLLDVLSRIEGWLRFQNSRVLKDTLEIELQDPRKRSAYEDTDGTRSLRDVAHANGVPPATLQNWWSRWLSIGIVTESPARKGRMNQICSLKSLGLDVPKSKSAVTPQSVDQP